MSVVQYLKLELPKISKFTPTNSWNSVDKKEVKLIKFELKSYNFHEKVKVTSKLVYIIAFSVNHINFVTGNAYKNYLVYSYYTSWYFLVEIFYRESL